MDYAVFDPWGIALASAGDEPAIVMTTIDRQAVPDARGRFCLLADHRLLFSRCPRLSFRRPGERPLVMEVGDVAIAGYTGRDTEAVKRYIEKLAEEGISPPESVPAVFRVGADRVMAHDVIDVTGLETCGEIEFVLLVTEEGVHVTVGGGHTDRALEQQSILLSKQVVPKVVAAEAWRLDEVAGHWDELRLVSTLGEGRPYQEPGVDFFVPPQAILDLVDARPGTVVYGGTVSSLMGGFDYDPVFAGRLEDPVLERSIEFTYRSRPMEGK